MQAHTTLLGFLFANISFPLHSTLFMHSFGRLVSIQPTCETTLCILISVVWHVLPPDVAPSRLGNPRPRWLAVFPKAPGARCPSEIR